MISITCLLHTAEHTKRLLDSSETDYSEWNLHSKKTHSNFTVEEYRLKSGPEKPPIKHNCLLHLFACLCCSKTIYNGHKKLTKKYVDTYTFKYIPESSTIQRFYPYR